MNFLRLPPGADFFVSLLAIPTQLLLLAPPLYRKGKGRRNFSLRQSGTGCNAAPDAAQTKTVECKEACSTSAAVQSAYKKFLHPFPVLSPQTIIAQAAKFPALPRWDCWVDSPVRIRPPLTTIKWQDACFGRGRIHPGAQNGIQHFCGSVPGKLRVCSALS